MHKRPADILKERGLRKTKPRRAILAILESARSPLSIADINNDPRARGIDTVTVYRTLETFKAGGIVTQTDLQRGRAYFELKDRKDHHHLVCMSCERVEDFTGCDYGMLAARALRQASRFASISGHSLELFGLCVPCSKNN